MSRRTAFHIALVLSALCAFAASALEYSSVWRDSGSDRLIFLAATLPLVGAVAFCVLAGRAFKGTLDSHVVADALLAAALPFLTAYLMNVNHIDPNVHGIAVVGFFLWGASSIFCALIMLVAVAIRAARRRRS